MLAYFNQHIVGRILHSVGVVLDKRALQAFHYFTAYHVKIVRVSLIAATRKTWMRKQEKNGGERRMPWRGHKIRLLWLKKKQGDL